MAFHCNLSQNTKGSKQQTEGKTTNSVLFAFRLKNLQDRDIN